MRHFLLVVVFISTSCFAQTISPAQRKAMNNYVDCASQSASEVNAVIKSLQYYYLTFYRVEYVVPRFTCPIQMQEDLFAVARKESSGLPPAIASSLNDKLTALQSDITKIHLGCQSLETYHKLKDFERDDLAKADKIINELQLLVKSYHTNQAQLSIALASGYGKLNTSGNPAYRKADELMREAISNEYAYLDKWTVNLKESVHTGWPFDQLKESISHTEASIKKLQSLDLSVSFREALDDLLKIKQHALDNYNPAARTSDKLGNDLYFDLMNNLNGALISDYNSFIDDGIKNGYSGLRAIPYAPAFEVRKTAAEVSLAVKPFTDTPHIPITLAKQKTPLSRAAFVSLNQYVIFINETLGPVEIISKKTENFSSTAADYKELTSFARRDQLAYEVTNFKIPLTEYSQTIAGSKSLPPSISKSLNAQATVLLDLLKELEQLVVILGNETSTRNYEKDKLERIYQLMERQKELLLIWDERKEQLYDDVRMVFDAYPPADPQAPWHKSGQALQRLADADHTALFEAKDAYRKNDVSKGVATGAIDTLVRAVIEDEFANLKGIPRLGGSNGNDPYTPYEKLPQISSVLSEKFSALKPASVRPPGFNHPYNEQVHLYNVGMNALNKFSELSKTVFVLQMALQPPLFKLIYPEKKVVEEEVKETPKEKVAQEVIEVVNQEVNEVDPNLRSMEGYAVNNMVLLIDISGSMNTPDKLPLLKQSLLSMLPMMRPEDKVSIVVYSEKPKVVLEPTSFTDENKIKKIISRLTASGKTNGNAGLKMAYKVADENYIRGGNNRIILATDGEFPVNEELQKYIADFSQQDIFLSVFNFGAKDKTRDSLEQLSTIGRGHFTDINKESAETGLIREAKSKRAN